MKTHLRFATTAGLTLGLLLLGASAVAQQAPPPRDAPPPPPHADEAPGQDANDLGPDHQRWDRWHGRDDPRIAEHLEGVIAVVRDIDPQLAERIENIHDDRPGMKMLAVRRAFPQVFRLVRLREDDPEMYALRIDDMKLQRRSNELVRQIRAARRAGDDREAADFVDDLEDVVEEHFDLRQQIRELEIDRLEARIEALKDALSERRHNRRDLMEDRIRDLLKDPRDAGNAGF